MALSYTQAFITLASEEFDQLVNFYQALLDQVPQPYNAERYAEFQLAGLQLGIFKPSTNQHQEFAARNSGSMSLCLEVADLVAAIATLTQLGYPPPGNILYASHGQEIYAYDPAGNRLILHQSQ